MHNPCAEFVDQDGHQRPDQLNGAGQHAPNHRHRALLDVEVLHKRGEEDAEGVGYAV